MSGARGRRYLSGSPAPGEQEELCNRIMSAIKAENNQAWLRVQRQLEKPDWDKRRELDPKAARLQILMELEPQLVRAVIASFDGQRSPKNCFDMLEKWAVAKVNPLALTGGNFNKL